MVVLKIYYKNENSHLLVKTYHKKQQNKKQNMFKAKKKDTRAMSINCVFMSIGGVFFQ